MPVIFSTSTSSRALNANAPGKRVPPALAIGTRLRSAGAPADWTESTGANTCVFDTAATVIASGALPGEPTVPRPNSSRSLPAEITGTTPAAATLCTTSIIASFAGSVSGAAAREVDHVHPVADGGLERGRDLRGVGDVPDRRRHVEDPVVAQVRARRDAGEAAGGGMIGAAAASRCPESPAAMPATCVAWKRRGGRRRVARGDPRAVRENCVRRSPSARSTSCRRAGIPADTQDRPERGTGSSLSTPSSTIAILTPSPRAPVSAWSSSAPITPGLVSVRRWYVTLG